MRVWMWAAFAAAGVACSSSAQAADTASLKVVGQKQGAIATGIEVLDFNYSITSPRDPQSGLPTGKRMHKPFVVMIPWSPAAVGLYNAVAMNENLSQVMISDAGGVGGRPGARFTVELTNASVSDFEILDSNGKDPGVEPVVKVTFTFQKITLSDVAGGKSAADDWEARN